MIGKIPGRARREEVREEVVRRWIRKIIEGVDKKIVKVEKTRKVAIPE